MERIKGANGELMKYSMQPMDGRGHLTLYRYDQLAVGGADNAHLEFWIEIEELRKQLADAQATIAALQARVQELEKNRDKPIEQVDPRYWDVNELRANVELKARHIDEIQSQLTQRTAELERVRERVGQRGLEVVMIGKVGHYVSTAVKEELERVRGLIKALPKVEGVVDIKRGEGLWYVWMILPNGSYVMCGRFRSQLEAEAYAAILTHRQGMEG